MKIFLYVATGLLALVGLFIWAAGMSSLEEQDFALARISFSLASVCIALIAGGWFSALIATGFRGFLVWSLGFALCGTALSFFATSEAGLQVLPAALFALGVGLVMVYPSRSGVRLAQGLVGGAFFFSGVCLAWTSPSLWIGAILLALGLCAVFARRPFSVLMLLVQTVGALITVAGFLFLIQRFAAITTLDTILFTLILIVGVLFLCLPYLLERMAQFRIIGKAHGQTVDSLFAAMRDTETVLGTPWLCSVPLLGKSILFGPHKDGACVYISKICNVFCISLVEVSLGLKPEPKDQWRLEKPSKYTRKDGSIWAYSLELLLFHQSLEQAVRTFLQGGAFTLPAHTFLEGTFYSFDEEFRLLSQTFAMQTMDKEPVYTIHAPLPLLTFTIADALSGEDILVVHKHFLRMREQYSFVWNGEAYGTFSKKFDPVLDIFTMQTPDGLLQMTEVMGTLGANYRVSLEGREIGLIASQLNPTLRNLVFNNYLIYVRDEKYRPLMAALAAMSAREAARDRTSALLSWNSNSA